MSRSEIHLTSEKNSNGVSTIKVVHNKSNFGPKCEDFLIDINFTSEFVSINKSNSLTNTEQQLLDIRSFILEKKAEGKTLNQTDIVKHFQGTIGRETVRDLLDKGCGNYWNTAKGSKNSTIYDPIDSRHI